MSAWQASLALIDVKLAFYDEWIATGERPASEGGAGKTAAAAQAAQGVADRKRSKRR